MVNNSLARVRTQLVKASSASSSAQQSFQSAGESTGSASANSARQAFERATSDTLETDSSEHGRQAGDGVCDLERAQNRGLGEVRAGYDHHRKAIQELRSLSTLSNAAGLDPSFSNKVDDLVDRLQGGDRQVDSTQEALQEAQSAISRAQSAARHIAEDESPGDFTFALDVSDAGREGARKVDSAESHLQTAHSGAWGLANLHGEVWQLTDDLHTNLASFQEPDPQVPTVTSPSARTQPRSYPKGSDPFAIAQGKTTWQATPNRPSPETQAAHVPEPTAPTPPTESHWQVLQPGPRSSGISPDSLHSGWLLTSSSLVRQR